jgi:transcriptional regulator with XRE-family HTH domain
MLIGERLRQLREEQSLSQGDIEQRTGLIRCYVSRVECGHTIPTVETLEKWSRALDIPLWKLFAEPGAPAPKKLMRSPADSSDTVLKPFLKLLPKIAAGKRKALLKMAADMASKK